MLAFVKFILMLMMLVRSGPTVPEPPAMLTRVNDLRAEYGLAPLEYDQRLENVAVIRSREIVTHLAHEHFEVLGAQQGIQAEWFGENLARHDISVDAVWQMWLDSPPHLANLLDPEWKAMGFAVHEEGGILYVALEFRT